MSDTTQRRQLALGIFISIGIAIFVVGVLTIGGQHKAFTRSIQVHVIFDDVQGLQPGNNVWLSGLKIGTVKRVSFYKNAQVEVILAVEHEAQAHIHRDATARVGTDGLVGNKIVVLTGGSDSLPLIADGGVVLASHTASLQEMFGTLQGSGADLRVIAANLRVMSDRLLAGRGTLGKLLNDNSYAEQLRVTLARLREASLAGDRMLGNLEGFSERLQHSTGLVNELLSDTVIYERLRSAAQRFDEVSAKASMFADTLRVAGRGLNDPNSPAGVILHDGVIADQLQRTMKNLEVSSEELRRDLEAVRHNFLLRGFFKKRKDN